MPGWIMVKFALLVSDAEGVDTPEMRIRADEVATPLTVHGSVPSLAVLATITVGNVSPPSVERSIFTVPVRLVDVHRMFCADPSTQLSSPSGAVTVTVGCTMVK